ncbi:MAG: tetratricopeptide repeat protein [Rubripirellula sp.]
MEARFYATCLWPGLSDVWYRGKLSALPAAVGFGVAINLLLISRYIYPGLLTGGLVTMTFWIGVVAWVFYVIRSIRELPGKIAPRTMTTEPDRFPEARDAYLRGDWAEAEKLITGVLAIEPRDPPALLMLTGVYRHTDRLEAAEILLEEIARLEVSDTWWLEIEAEAKRLNRALEASSESAAEDRKAPSSDSKDAADLTAKSGMAA